MSSGRFAARRQPVDRALTHLVLTGAASCLSITWVEPPLLDEKKPIFRLLSDQVDGGRKRFQAHTVLALSPSPNPDPGQTPPIRLPLNGHLPTLDAIPTSRDPLA